MHKRNIKKQYWDVQEEKTGLAGLEEDRTGIIANNNICKW